MTDRLWSIAVDAPIFNPLTYSDDLNNLERGLAVKVPLGSRSVAGVVLGPSTEELKVGIKVKPVKEKHPELPQLPEPYIKWVEWLGKYYIHPVGQVFKLSFPPLKKEGRARKASPIPELESDTAPELTPNQKTIIDDILSEEGFQTHLVHGITGSGKTEIYLNILSKVIEKGKQGLVLVPEISLTPQLINRFVKRFGNQVAVIHSQLTDRERTNQWWDIIQGKKKILIGVRSALFCPIANLGAVIVDEEHEPSFKQDEKLKYHARDAAVMLGQFSNCPVVLGSATPSLESWHNSQQGRYKLHSLPDRIGDATLPEVEIIDLKNEGDGDRDSNKGDRPFWVTKPLFEKIKDRLAIRQQSVIFLNRRGEAPSVICTDCGATKECPNCSVHLTLHSKSHLVCHYCDYHENFKPHCSECGAEAIKALGLGTEKIESDLKTIFPEARIARADRDEISSREEMEELIQNMESGDIDILIGTQMIAKGLDFPLLTLVGVVLADISLNIPDFRASERSFQLLVQVAGRAGRHKDPGEVVIQTYNPGHPSLVHSAHHDYVSFVEQELQARKELNYPPFGRLASIRFQGNNVDRVKESSRIIAERARQLTQRSAEFSTIEVLGPAPSPLMKLRGKYRFHILIKGPKGPVVTQFCRNLFRYNQDLPPGTKMSFDIDPLHLL